MENNTSSRCQSCRQPISHSAVFCPHCGAKQKLANSPSNKIATPNTPTSTTSNLTTTPPNPSSTDSPTFSEQLAKNNPLIPFFQKIKDFVLQHKIPLLSGSSIIILLVIGLALFNALYDFTELYWDPDEISTSLEYTSASTISLRANAYDKEHLPIDDITFETTDGTIESYQNSVTWYLPKANGIYTIRAIAPSGKTITKTIEVYQTDSEPLAGLLSAEVDDATADTDQDGLTNAEEQELGTNPHSADTDQDGLSDYYEIRVSKTDPLNADSDSDGLRDGDELDLGLDPLKADSKGDGIKDGDRTLTTTINNSTAKVDLAITGKGNIASTTVDVIENPYFNKLSGIISQIYNFHTDGELEIAKVSIAYDPAKLAAQGLNEQDLTLYYFDDITKHLEPISTTIDTVNHTASAELSHFSKYLLGSKNVSATDSTTDILFIIDNSVSMYSEAQMSAAGYTSTGAVGNDTSFKRLSLTNSMIDRMTGDYRFAVSEFAGNYVNLKHFTSNQATAKTAVDSMNTNWHATASGTFIARALTEGLKEFSDDAHERYIVLLTDGLDNSDQFEVSQETIIANAKKLNTKICIIGLGNDIDTKILSTIAEQTGCHYYNASNANALDEIYNVMSASLNYGYIDTDQDNTTDGIITADSGFITSRDGFAFRNFVSNKANNGHCYGMATFAMLYYQKALALQLSEHSVSKFYLGNLQKVNWHADAYDLTNTYFAKHENLYDFTLTTPGLKLYMEDNPADYRDRVENDTWMIKTNYYDDLTKIGITISNKDYQGQSLGADLKFSQYQSAQLQINDDTFNQNVTKDERELFNAIWRLYITQADSKELHFSADPDQAFQTLQDNLSSGKPAVLGINSNHAINAVRLIQDNNDANQFKLEVYDNNYPGETRYIEITRQKYNKIQLDYTAWVNEYSYAFTYDYDNNGTTDDITVSVDTTGNNLVYQPASANAVSH